VQAVGTDNAVSTRCATVTPGLGVKANYSLCPHGFFLQTPDESVGDLWGKQIGKKEGVVEGALGGQDHESGKPARLGDRHEGSGMRISLPCRQLSYVLSERIEVVEMKLTASAFVRFPPLLICCDVHEMSCEQSSGSRVGIDQQKCRSKKVK